MYFIVLFYRTEVFDRINMCKSSRTRLCSKPPKKSAQTDKICGNGLLRLGKSGVSGRKGAEVKC